MTKEQTENLDWPAYLNEDDAVFVYAWLMGRIKGILRCTFEPEKQRLARISEVLDEYDEWCKRRFNIT